MTGQIGIGFLNPIFGLDEILKGRESIEELSDLATPESLLETISESSTVTVT